MWTRIICRWKSFTRTIDHWPLDFPQEIFATFGEIKEIEFGSERQRPWLNKGFAYIEYKTHTDALNAMKHMDGGQIDGQVK